MSKSQQLIPLSGILICCFLTGGCTETVHPIEQLEIRGDYMDEWGGLHTIANDLWSITFEGGPTGLFHIEQYDNYNRVLFTQNDEDNEWNGGLYSRFDWAWNQEGTLFFCQAAFDALTLTEAMETASPDTADLTVSGCGGFSWTALEPL